MTVLRIPAVFLLVAGLGLPAHNVLADRIVLRGGSIVEAPIVKQDTKSVVLDIGYDVLRIPAAEIIEILADTADGQSANTESSLYRVSAAERLSTAEAVDRYAPAVTVVRTPGGLGSGFFVNRQGLLITNFHVIHRERHISVLRFAVEGGTQRRIVHKDVEIVASDPFHDLAVLRVKDPGVNIVPVVFAPGQQSRIGETVFAIGNPLGLERTVTEGVVSQAARNFRGILYLQVDAPVNPGNSGGPLFNDRGRVIGIINMGVPAMEGLNFAIPARHAMFLLDHLDAFTYDDANPESGFVYPDPPPRPGKARSANDEHVSQPTAGD